jgi:hypothetical protein
MLAIGAPDAASPLPYDFVFLTGRHSRVRLRTAQRPIFSSFRPRPNFLGFHVAQHDAPAAASAGGKQREPALPDPDHALIAGSHSPHIAEQLQGTLGRPFRTVIEDN